MPAIITSDVSACAGQAVNLMGDGFPAGGVFSVSESVYRTVNDIYLYVHG
ncbi:MAG: hypothetical protein IPN26_10120 [Bacteroidetes bacterium]|nr:hypothetical protein [Bacteroidota bacterium]